MHTKSSHVSLKRFNIASTYTVHIQPEKQKLRFITQWTVIRLIDVTWYTTTQKCNDDDDDDDDKKGLYILANDWRLNGVNTKKKKDLKVFVAFLCFTEKN